MRHGPVHGLLITLIWHGHVVIVLSNLYHGINQIISRKYTIIIIAVHNCFLLVHFDLYPVQMHYILNQKHLSLHYKVPSYVMCLFGKWKFQSKHLNLNLSFNFISIRHILISDIFLHSYESWGGGGGG